MYGSAVFLISSSGKSQKNVTFGMRSIYGAQKDFSPSCFQYMIKTVRRSCSQSLCSSVKISLWSEKIGPTTGSAKHLSVLMMTLSGTQRNASLCYIFSLTFMPTSPPSKNDGYSILGQSMPTSSHHYRNLAVFCLTISFSMSD